MWHNESTALTTAVAITLASGPKKDSAVITMALPVNLVLPMSLDGETWHNVEFEGETSRYVDQQAAAYVITYRDRMHFGVCENVRWADFPATYQAIFREVYASVHEHLSI